MESTQRRDMYDTTCVQINDYTVQITGDGYRLLVSARYHDENKPPADEGHTRATTTNEFEGTSHALCDGAPGARGRYGDFAPIEAFDETTETVTFVAPAGEGHGIVTRFLLAPDSGRKKLATKEHYANDGADADSVRRTNTVFLHTDGSRTYVSGRDATSQKYFLAAGDAADVAHFYVIHGDVDPQARTLDERSRVHALTIVIEPPPPEPAPEAVYREAKHSRSDDSDSSAKRGRSGDGGRFAV
jgi:hypothetical protein